VQVQNRYVHLSWVADPTIKNNILYTQSWEVGDTTIYIFRLILPDQPAYSVLAHDIYNVKRFLFQIPWFGGQHTRTLYAGLTSK
jgi:hypothetical protein